MNFARLNHILIPSTKAGRDGFRKTRTGRMLRPLFAVYLALTDEGGFLATFWLICGAAGMEVGTTQIYIMWSAVTGLLVASLLMRRLYRLDDATVRVEAPRRVTCGDDASFAVCLTNTSEDVHRAIRIERPLLPWDGSYPEARPSIAEVGPGETARSLVRIRFSQRGEHHLDPFYVGKAVPLNLTVGPALSTQGARFLVVPRPARVERLSLPMGARYQPGGVTVASRTGESLDFIGIRPYRAGDRIRDIHHRSWARTGFVVVREYQQEYFTRVGVILDTDLASASEEAFEAAIELAAGITAHLSRGEALIDLLVFGEQIHELHMGRHLGRLEQALDLLACVEPGPTLDPGSMSSGLMPHLPRLSCLVFVALAWDEPRQQLLDSFRRAGTACRALVIGDAASGPDIVSVDAGRVRSGEALSL